MGSECKLKLRILRMKQHLSQFNPELKDGDLILGSG